jgi:FkbM family methyltransferase
MIIVYYIYINPNRDWDKIVNGQLTDLNTIGLLKKSKIYIHICSENAKYLEECKELLNTYSSSFIISTSNINQYQYPGINLLYNVCQNNKNEIVYYMHTKGMVNNNYENYRSDQEKINFRYTIKDYEKVLNIFNQNVSINKIGRDDFFWIKSNYLLDTHHPILTNDKDYYKKYGGELLKLNEKSCEEIQNSTEYLITTSFFNLKKYTFFYGNKDNMIDVTEIVHKKCLRDNLINIPMGDGNRSRIFGDPLPGVYKYFYIKVFNKLNTYSELDNIYIDLITDRIYQIDNLPFKIQNDYFSSTLDNKLKLIHSFLKLEYGTFNEEYPEQIMALKYLSGKEKVLEIGANIGRNSLVINFLLSNNKNSLLSLESDTQSFNKLKRNMEINNFNFHIENSALSARKLIQKDWDTIPSEEILDGYFPVNTITLQDLRKKYPINFDTLVLDCEGAFYYILMDTPEILDGINLIIMENDYHDISHKKYIDSVLKQNNFYVDYTHPLEFTSYVMKCTDYFYEVWKRNVL